MTMAYVMNRMGEGTVGDDRAHPILRACYARSPVMADFTQHTDFDPDGIEWVGVGRAAAATS